MDEDSLEKSNISLFSSEAIITLSESKCLNSFTIKNDKRDNYDLRTQIDGPDFMGKKSIHRVIF